jgi:hypothetical protein
MNYLSEDDLFLKRFVQGMITDMVINCFADKPKFYNMHKVQGFIIHEARFLRMFIEELL